MPRRNRARLIAGIAVLALAGLILTGLVPRLAQARLHGAEPPAGSEAMMSVLVAPARRAALTSEVTIPGTLQALHEAQLYARTSGYVRRWYADIGTQVKPGDVLAELASPDLEQEYEQARASAAQTSATAAFARTSYERWRSLERDSAISQQELDEKASAAKVATAAEQAAAANARRLAELKGFTRILAPFRGVVTQRTVDVGALVTPGTGPQGRGLFTVAQTDSVRVYVSIPESYAPSVQVGRKAEVRIASAPGQAFMGTVARTAKAIDPASRTLLTEVVIPNSDGRLLPGSSAMVTLHVELQTPPIIAPANALIVGASGTRVATVAGDTVALTEVQLGRDFGDSVEIVQGLQEGQVLVVNPGDDLLSGMRVKAAPQPKP